MHVIFQDQYHNQSTEQNKAYLRDQLDKLKDAGVNAVIFQIRPQADALYPSEIEGKASIRLTLRDLLAASTSAKAA